MSRTFRMQNSWNKHLTTKQEIHDILCRCLMVYSTVERAFEAHEKWLARMEKIDSRWNRDGSIIGWKTVYDKREMERDSRARKRSDLHKLIQDPEYIPADERGERRKARGGWWYW